MDNGSNGNSSALAVVEPTAISLPAMESAVAQWRRTTDIASLVRSVVMQSTVTIQGRKYLTVAGFQAVANAFGCVASARDVERVEGGWRAIGEVKRMSDGMVLSTGTGFLGDDEKVWQSRPQFSKMAMAQTRACGRALRAAFAFMAPVIDGNLQTTPAEEYEIVAQQNTVDPPAPVVRGGAALTNALRPSSPTMSSTAAPRHAEPPPHEDADFRPSSSPPRAQATTATHDQNFAFRFGNEKGVPLRAISESGLKFYEKCLHNDLANPEKQQYAQSNTLALTNVQAEIRHRGI